MSERTYSLFPHGSDFGDPTHLLALAACSCMDQGMVSKEHTSCGVTEYFCQWSICFPQLLDLLGTPLKGAPSRTQLLPAEQRDQDSPDSMIPKVLGASQTHRCLGQRFKIRMSHLQGGTPVFLRSLQTQPANWFMCFLIREVST